MKRNLALFTLIFIVAGAATAEESLTNFESTRSAGRGHTFVANPYSYESPRQNPAVLSEVKKSTLEFRWIEFDAFIGENSVETADDIVIAMGSSDKNSLGKILDAFGDKFGKRQYGSVQIFPLGLRWNSFVIEPFLSTKNFIEMRVPPLPRLALFSDSRLGANISYAQVLGKSLEIGATVRPFWRVHVQGDVQATDVVQVATSSESKTNDYVKSTSGNYTAFDLGALWALSPGFRWGLVVHDVGDTAASGDSTDRAPNIKSRISTGFFFRKNFWRGWHFDSTLDLQDILNRNGIDPIRLIHGGIEVGKNYFTTDNDVGVQVGVNDGWLSLGGFVDLYFLKLGLANYGVETGHSPGQRQDRRWAFSAQSSFAF